MNFREKSKSKSVVRELTGRQKCSGDCDCKVWRNSFYGEDGSVGHLNESSATPFFNYYSNGRNIIDDRYDVYSITVDGGAPGYDYGYNAIYQSSNGHIYNASGQTINARNNYWAGTFTSSEALWYICQN